MTTRRMIVVRVAFVSAHAGRGADAVAHAVHAQLGPALAPQVRRDVRAVDRRQHVAQLLRARRHTAMNLADIDRRGVEVARHGAADASRLVQVDAEIVSDDAADGAAPPDDARDRLLVDRILRRDDEAVGRQIRPDQGRRPFGVVGLAGHDRDVDRLLLRQRLHLGEVHRRDGNRAGLLVRHAREMKSVLPDRLDVFGPGIDQRDIVAGARKMTAEISADRARTDDRNALSHQASPGTRVAQGCRAFPSASKTCAAARSMPSRCRSPTFTATSGPTRAKTGFSTPAMRDAKMVSAPSGSTWTISALDGGAAGLRNRKSSPAGCRR